MKKLIGVSIVGAVLVVGIVFLFMAKPALNPLLSVEAKTCMRVADLCTPGVAADLQKLNDCEEALKSVKRLSGDEAFSKSTTCVADANSCAAAGGCMMGGAGVGAVSEFLKGFANAASSGK